MRQLVSVAYMPELHWHVLTVVDLGAARVLDTDWLWPAAIGLVLLFAALLLCFGYAIERLMLRPLRRLQQSARAIANGSHDVRLPPGGQDEIGDLSRAFGVMADKVRQHTAELESKVRERTSELEDANRAMAAAHKKIGDSIDYASLIQRAILPDRQLTQSLGAHHFVLWKPRDVVGGDFYVFRSDGANCLLGIMDCAGHGVPGALMTMLARAAIDLAITEAGPADPAGILTRTDSAIRAMLADAQRRGRWPPTRTRGWYILTANPAACGMPAPRSACTPATARPCAKCPGASARWATSGSGLTRTSNCAWSRVGPITWRPTASWIRPAASMASVSATRVSPKCSRDTRGSR